MTTVILDNGHGQETPGKCSPKWSDGSQLFEWEFNRDIVRRISDLLTKENIQHHILVPELTDISLGVRCTRANKIFANTNRQAFLLSIHANAGGGTGWECFTSEGETKSDALATVFCEAAQKEFPEKKMRFDFSDNDPDKESPFYILKNTHCPAVLTENFFMDTETDCRLLMSDTGRERIARMHVEAIKLIVSQ